MIMTRFLLLGCVLALSSTTGEPVAVLAPAATAHPFSKEIHSLYGALRADEAKVSAVVILEVPRTLVVADIQERIKQGVPKKKALKAHDQSRFDALAAGLSLSVNDVPAPVTWRPLAHPSNGKVVDDFFMYWVGAEIPVDPTWGNTVTVQLDNRAYTDVDMVYSGTVQARGSAKVTLNSAATVIGQDPSTMDRTDPAAWTDDARMRSLRGSWKLR